MLSAAQSIGDAEGERYLCHELAKRCAEVGDAAGGRVIGAGGSAEEAEAKVAQYQKRAAEHRARTMQIEAIIGAPPSIDYDELD